MPEPSRFNVIPFPTLGRRERPRRLGAATALDLDGPLLRVAQSGGGAITDLATSPLDLPAGTDRSDPAALGRALAAALDKLRVRPGPVVFALPRAQVYLRTLAVPVVADVSELASIVHLQLARELPFRMDEAVIDFQVLRQFTPAVKPSDPKAALEAPAPSPKLEILAAAVKRDVVEFHESLATAAGLKLAALGWIASAEARCLAACSAAEAPAALVTLRAGEVGVDVVTGRGVLFSRGAAVPGGDFAEAATIEVVRSLHNFGGLAGGTAVARTVVAGATGHETAVIKLLASRLAIPCGALEFAKLGLPASARDSAAGASAAIGLALGATDDGGLAFDFIDPKRPADRRDLRRVKVLGGIAAAAALFILLFAVRSSLVQKREANLKEAQLELAAEDKKRPIYRRMTQQAATVKAWQAEGRDWLDHYAWLSAVLPRSEDLYVTSLAVGGGGSIRLAVQARTGEMLARLDKQLRAAGYDVKPLAITPGTDRFGYNFRSTVELTAPEKLKLDLTKAQPAARPADDASLDAVKKGGSK